ncbi:MAG: DNA primase, partial [Erysipelotrichaceae bacterium]|nr:DNA primase [Erysipelotrichaceae bacterium]
MSWIKEEDLKAIRQQADIVDILSQYLTLEKKGRSYVAVCPFHDDHDPSLSISTDKQIFKCFVCGTGGNVFSFVQKMENISFPEAVVKVAELIGYPLNVSKDVFAPKENKNQKLFDVVQLYIRFLQYELNSKEGRLALDYLQKRKINEDILRRFEFGYAPDREKSVNYLKAKQVDDSQGEKTGLLRDGQAVFHNRIMIPIHDEHGNPVGFTARTLTTDKSEPKYVNTAQTEIYEKGNIVFNYHRAKDFCRKNKRCILTEGAMDVIAFEKADIHESVACLGTACTAQQLNLLKQLRVPITICYDGDRAGQEATYKFAKMAIANRMDVTVVKNDTGKDPDEIYDESGKEGLAAFVSKTISVVDFLFDYGSVTYNLDNYDERKTFAQEMFSVISAVCQGFEKPAYYQKLNSLTGYDFSNMEPEKPAVPKPARQAARIPLAPVKESGRLKAEKVVLSMMLVSPKACERFKEEVGF